MTNPAPNPPPPAPNDLPTRLLGGLVGAAIGIVAYWLALGRGVDVLIAVGAGLALGVARGSRRRSLAWGAGIAVVAPMLALGTLWWFRPFADDPSLGHFLSHLHELPRQALMSLGASALAGGWFGMGRNRR